MCTQHTSGERNGRSQFQIRDKGSQWKRFKTNQITTDKMQKQIFFDKKKMFLKQPNV